MLFLNISLLCLHAPLAYRRVHSLAGSLKKKETQIKGLKKKAYINLHNQKMLIFYLEAVNRKTRIQTTRFNSFSLIWLPVLCNVFREWIIRVWSTQKCLNAETRVKKLKLLITKTLKLGAHFHSIHQSCILRSVPRKMRKLFQNMIQYLIPQKYSSDLKCRTPLVFKNIKTYPSKLHNNGIHKQGIFWLISTCKRVEKDNKPYQCSDGRFW